MLPDHSPVLKDFRAGIHGTAWCGLTGLAAFTLRDCPLDWPVIVGSMGTLPLSAHGVTVHLSCSPIGVQVSAPLLTRSQEGWRGRGITEGCLSDGHRECHLWIFCSLNSIKSLTHCRWAGFLIVPVSLEGCGESAPSSLKTIFLPFAVDPHPEGNQASRQRC